MQTRLPTLAGCEDSVIDLAFVVDASGSICENDQTFDNVQNTCENWRSVLQFIRDAVSELTIGPSNAQVALIVYSNNAVVEWPLGA